MKINPQTNTPFTSLELSSIAREYYIGFKSRQVDFGFDMLVATDGINTMSVLPDYVPESDDIHVFFCTVRRQVENDGYVKHIGVWDMTSILPTCQPCPVGADLHDAWMVIRKRATPEYFTKNGVHYRNGRPASPEDQDRYDREKDRRKYKHRADYGAYLALRRKLQGQDDNNINSQSV